MSRVFYLPQHRTLSTRHPLALRRMRSTGCWVSANERRYWKYLGSPPGVWTPAFSAAGRRSTTRPLSCLNLRMTVEIWKDGSFAVKCAGKFWKLIWKESSQQKSVCKCLQLKIHAKNVRFSAIFGAKMGDNGGCWSRPWVLLSLTT